MTPRSPFHLPPTLQFESAADVVVRLGQWVWLHVLSPFWRDPEGWPFYCWILPLLILLLVIFFVCRKWAGSNLAYRSPRLFNLIHGRFWAPITVICLWAMLFFDAPLLASRIGPSWRLGDWLCMTKQTAFITFAALFLLGIVPLLFLLIRLIRSSVDSGIHGEAAWAARHELRISRTRPWLIPIKVHFRGSRRPWMGGGGMVAFAPSREVSRRHTIVIGGTGSGKGHFIFGHILASARQALIYQDVKAECPAHDHWVSANGKEPIKWGAGRPGGYPSACWNPLEECRQDENPYDAFASLAAVLISGDEKDWVPQLSRPILASVLISGRYETLGDLADDFTMRGVEAVLKDAEVPHGLLESLEGKNVKEYIGTTLFSCLSSFQSGWGRQVTSGHDFSVDDMLHKGGYVLSAEAEPSRRLPLTLFWRMLFRRTLRSYETYDLSILLDEGLAAGKIPNFTDALNTMRSKGVGIIFAIQNSAGLREVYGPQGGPAVEEAFTNRITLLNGLNAEDAEKLSKRLGTYTRVRSQRHGPSTHDRAELMPLEEVMRRGAGEVDRWAVFEVVGATVSKRAIMARLVPTELAIHPLLPSDVQQCKECTSSALPILCVDDPELPQGASANIQQDSVPEEFSGF